MPPLLGDVVNDSPRHPHRAHFQRTLLPILVLAQETRMTSSGLHVKYGHVVNVAEQRNICSDILVIFKNRSAGKAVYSFGLLSWARGVFRHSCSEGNFG